MGQAIARLNDKYFTGEDQSSKQESKVILHDVTPDEHDTNASQQLDAKANFFDTPKTPPNVVKLKYDPRSPSDFDRTPIKVPLEDN